MKVTYKKDGIITKERKSRKEIEKTYSAKNKTITHLCWEKCPVALCNAGACPEVIDIDKQPIEDYDFINSGVQAYKESGEMSLFIVDDCTLYNNYQEEQEDKPKVKVK